MIIDFGAERYDVLLCTWSAIWIFGSGIFRLGVWHSSQVVFVLLFVFLQLYLILMMIFNWLRQAWQNKFLMHRRVAIPLFEWVLWFHHFWVLVHCWSFQHIIFLIHRLLWIDCVVDLLSFLVVHIGTRGISFQCIQACWYQPFYICSSSLVNFRKINFCSCLQLPTHSFLWSLLSGIFLFPCLFNIYRNCQHQAQIWLGLFCGAIVLGFVLLK